MRKFADAEIRPHQQAWEEREEMGIDIWRKMGELGFLCPTVAPEYGGAGASKLYSLIIQEELAPLGGFGISVAMHSDIVAQYIEKYAGEDLKRRYLPAMAAGHCIGALGMSEPGAGSDVKAIRTRALKNGKHYVLNGSKTFISNGTVAASL